MTLAHSKLIFSLEETIAINDFIENFDEYMMRYSLSCNTEGSPCVWVEDNIVNIKFSDAKIVLELTNGTDNSEPDDEQKTFSIYFFYSKLPRLKKIADWDSIEAALDEVLKIVDVYMSNKSGIDFVDKLFTEKLNSIELNEIERLKRTIENRIRDQKIEDKLDYELKIRNDNYWRFYFITGYIELSLDRAISDKMRLFVVENTFCDDCELVFDEIKNGRFIRTKSARENIDNKEAGLRDVYFYASMSEAIDTILSYLEKHIDFYHTNCSWFTER